jgi:hypothetical protein
MSDESLIQYLVSEIEQLKEAVSILKNKSIVQDAKISTL